MNFVFIFSYISSHHSRSSFVNENRLEKSRQQTDNCDVKINLLKKIQKCLQKKSTAKRIKPIANLSQVID